MSSDVHDLPAEKVSSGRKDKAQGSPASNQGSFPQPWVDSRDDELKQIRGICLDIDDTLSTQGKLTSDAFDALWLLQDLGYAVVPITGRPAGWCDHIARFWPVHAVIGENGAFSFFMKNGKLKRVDTPAGLPSFDLKIQRDALKKKIPSRFPNVQWASDQNYREFDLAIDIREDVSPWEEGEVQALVNFCRQEGAHVKVSSIHVNTWYGHYDKRKGFENWLSSGMPGWSGAMIPAEQWLYIGDSPNDEPMFECFRYSVGVENIRPYLAQMQFHPKWITSDKSGKGFVQMVERLKNLKNTSSK